MLGATILVRVLGVGALRLLRFELGVLFLEGVGDVLEEDEAEDHVLVLGGVHAAAERVGHLPELGFVADGGGRGVGGRRVLLRLRHALPHTVSHSARIGTAKSPSPKLALASPS
jgi:hypothetical protein